jgi:hypothetical protein
MISLWLKLVYTAFVCILVPVYWVERGPANFLWASDIAMLATVAALWFESRLLASMIAVGVLLPELAWNVDFFLRLIAGFDVIGLNATGYMFISTYSPLFRMLSMFHVFLPVLLLWLVFRLGYDTRGLVAQCLLTWILLPVCYLFTDPARNLNWVFGIGNPPRALLPGGWFVVLLMVIYPVIIYLPTHFFLKKLFGRRG